MSRSSSPGKSPDWAELADYRLVTTQGEPLRVTAIAGTAELGGAERVLLDFANRAFEHDIALKVLFPADGPLVGILNKIGVPAEVVPAPASLHHGFRRGQWYRPGSLAGMLLWSRRLRRHPFVVEADVVYTVAFRAHVAATWGGLRPVVWHLHKFPPAAARGIWLRTARKRPARLIANSEAVAEGWGENREKGKGKAEKNRTAGSGKRETGGSGHVRVIHNGVNLDRFHPRERSHWIHDQLGIPHKHRLIGMPAVYARWKGHFEVIAAFEQIREEFPDTHLVIVGGSIYDTEAEHRFGKELRQVTGEFRVVVSGEQERVAGSGKGKEQRAAGSAKRAGGARKQPRDGSDGGYAEIVQAGIPNVHLLPFQREIEKAYPEFDLAVHYSLRPEPFGRVVLEAMACAVPIVAAGEGGPIEIVGDGIGPRREAGWLAEPRNPTALARIFRSALSLPTDVLSSIGAAGRTRAEDHFSARAFAGKVAKVLRDAGVGWGATDPYV
jgi:glycosyltransferase involved in cell wall biosynthesis